MKIVIVGAGSGGAALTAQLIEAGHRVSVIDPDRRTFDALPQMKIESGDITIVHGDGTSSDALEEAGIQDADVLLALAGKDARNGLVAHKAKLVYKVRRVICSVKDDRLGAIYEAAGIETVNPARLHTERVMATLQST
jgi:trk system potassium uptake protein TrkA